MQNNTSNKVKIEYNLGKIFSPVLWRMALSIFASMWLLLLAFLVFGVLLVFDIKILSYIVNIAFILLCGYFFYNRGLYTGTKHATSSEIAFKSRLLDNNFDGDMDNCFNKWRGFVAVIIANIPFLIVACYFAIHTQQQYYKLGSLPAWINQYTHYNNMDIALSYYTKDIGFTLIDILRIFVRGLIMPFISMFQGYGSHALLIVEKLSPILLLVVPSLYGFGYKNGEKQRILINKAISTNAKRKNIIARNKKAKKSFENSKKEII